MKRVWISILMLVVLSGCTQTPNKKRQAGKEVKQMVPAQALKDKADQALIQIVFYGLMVFHRDHPPSPTVIKALLPVAPNHTPRLTYGEYQGSDAWLWKDIVKDKEDNVKVNLVNKVISFTVDPEPGDGLEVPNHAASIGEFPMSASEARDADWLLDEEEILGVAHSVNPAPAIVTVRLERGEFETCGLVHSAQYHEACVATAGNALRAMSEYMVLRRVVPKDAKVYVNVGGTPVEIKPTGDPYQGYAKVFDIGISNVTPESSREEESNHGDHLRDFFIDLSDPWGKFSYDPVLCHDGFQPACWQRYATWGGSPGGYDRPLCPLIGGG